MRIFNLHRRVSEAIDNANRSITDLRFSITSVLLPLKLLLWFCISMVAIDVARGTGYGESLAYRTLIGAVDQLWYVIFYFALPFAWQTCRDIVDKTRQRKDWIVVNESTETVDESEWVII